MDEKEIMKMAISKYGDESQIDMAIEEMSELTKALLKRRRKIGSIDDILEEMADVSIMLDQLEIIFGDYKKIRDYKMCRLESRIKN